ncbi:Protein RKD3 [Hibiscus syriacus]|uniref:Protein RKD3 n=1 Tax=Hibiscus syriacus TaxID=106335 RepID=A0A6A2YK56_HIBSY|nr:Protein RKD3 [Hibiscus syriacus]
MDLGFPKFENGPEFDCINFEENPFRMLELSAFEMDSSYDFNSSSLPSQSNNACVEFMDFEEISNDFTLLDHNEDEMVDVKPLKAVVDSLGHHCGNMTNNSGSSGTLSKSRSRSFRRKRTGALELDEFQKYFDFPISKAAKEMNVGLTLLKKRCREPNILRWPHRKIKSLKSLINNVKELGLTNEIQVLEEHQRMLEKLPDMELPERTKKLRQACFKANYKKEVNTATFLHMF